MKLIHINAVKDVIQDWKAPYEVAAALDVADTVGIERFLKSMVRLGKAEYGRANNTYRAVQP